MKYLDLGKIKSSMCLYKANESTFNNICVNLLPCAIECKEVNQIKKGRL